LRGVTAALLTLVLVAGCDSGKKGEGEAVAEAMTVHHVTEFLMGTVVDLSVYARKDDPKVQGAIQAAMDEIRRIEALMTPWQKQTPLKALNAAAGQGWAPLSWEIGQVLDQALLVDEISGGSFDPTLGKLNQLWGFSNDVAPTAPPDPDRLQVLLKSAGRTRIAIRQAPSGREIRFADDNLWLDLGGIAKGYAIDRAFETLRAEGYDNIIVNAGGDVRLHGQRGDRPWRIGITDPRQEDDVIGVVSVGDRAVVTSGDYERFFMYEGKRYHHILDPHTGYSSRGVISATVIAPTATEADALSTAVFVLGIDKGLALAEGLLGVEALLIDEDQKIYRTTGFGRFMAD